MEQVCQELNTAPAISSASRKDVGDDFCWQDSGQAFLQARSFDEQFFVVQAQQVQDRGVPVLDCHFVFDG